MLHIKLTVLVTCLLLYICDTLCSDECIKLQLSISQKIANEGFHREINWLIESYFEESSHFNCNVSLQLEVPPEMFVNPDQISDLMRANQIVAFIEGIVNIETPTHESEGHTVYVFLPERIEKVLVQLPIHLRYQRAVIAGGFGKVNLPRPSLLVYCPQNTLQICGEHEKVKAPCDAVGNDLCTWDNVTYQALFDEVQLFVPIGDLDDYPIVAVVTLLLGCAGSIYVLSLLSTAPI